MKLNRNIKRAIVGNLIGGFCVAIFFIVLEIFTEISVLAALWAFSPAIISGLVGGLTGSVIFFYRRPDERAKLILTNSARISFWFLMLTMPYLGIIFMFIPTLNGMTYGLLLMTLWFLTFVIFWISAIYYYWK